MVLDKKVIKQIEVQLMNYPEIKQDKEDPWVKAINELIEHFKADIHLKVIEFHYFTRYRLQKILGVLRIERTCYYELREDVLYYLAFIAQRDGLIKVI